MNVFPDFGSLSGIGDLRVVIGAMLTIILIGPLISLAAWVVSVIFSIIAGLKANEGVAYRYPFAIRLIK